MNARTERLKNELMGRDDLSIFLERATLLEEARELFENEPYGKRYALGFKHLLDNMSVFIAADELIVGSVKEILPSGEEEAYFLDLAEQNNFSSLELFSFDPLNLIEIKDVGPRYAPSWFNSWGHMTVSWADLLSLGFEGIRERARRKLELLKPGLDNEHPKIHFLESAITASTAMIDFGKRYSLKAYEMAAAERCGQRKEELLKIAAVCNRVPAKPAETFYEGLQSTWFVNLIMHCLCGARDYGLGRFDQYLYPLYEKDIGQGILTREQALELLECFFIKQNEIIGRGVENYTPKRILSVNSLQYLIVGGMGSGGEDLANDLSLLILEAVEALKLKQPTVVVRYHREIDRQFFLKSCDLARQGLGYPSYYNDRVVVGALKNIGLPEEDAFNYVHYGCLNTNIPGKEDELREVWHNLPKYLELALNEGRCLLTGRAIGSKSEPALAIGSYERLIENFRLQVRWGVQLAVEKVEKSDRTWKELKPFSFESTLLRDCIDKAEDLTAGGVTIKHMNNHGVGIATLANSLVVLKKIVFEDQRYSLAEFRDILKVNFKGFEQLREEILSRHPKYGNDLEVVDRAAREGGSVFCEEVLASAPVPGSGRRLWPTFYSLWHQRDMGRHTAATPDGRLAGEAISESQSPVYGTEKYGPTAALNSVAKLPFEFTPGGGINIKFQPGLFRGAEGAKLLAAILEGYFEQGGLQAQLNFIDRSVLLDAKNNPDRHRDLLVRIVGYSAYFVTLSPEQKEEIINRTAL